MKKTAMILISAMLLLSAAFFPSVGGQKPASAAGEYKDVFQYDVYHGSGYLEINFYLDICDSTASSMVSAFAATAQSETDRLFDSVEKFFYAYESLMYNNAHAKFRRYKDVAAYNSSTHPYYSFNMYLYFQSDDKMTAGEKYMEYFKSEKSDGSDDSVKKGFFADREEVNDYTFFITPYLLPSLAIFPALTGFDGNTFLYSDFQPLASFNCVMLPFLLYGNRISLIDGSDTKKIEYGGLVNDNNFSSLFTGKTKSNSSLFSNFTLYHSLSASTTYIKTDAENKDSRQGEYLHAWEVSYAALSGDKLDPNRQITITYIQPHVINMYFFAMIIAAAFIGLMAVFLYLIPVISKYVKRKRQLDINLTINPSN